MKTFYETIKNSISINKEMLEIMPKKGIKKQKELEAKITDLKEKYNKIKDNVYKEIEIRYKKFDKMVENVQIEVLSKKLKQLNEIEIINSEKDAFEKMQLDRLVYDINGYYKKDLGATNKDIYECIKRFKSVGVNVSIDDFNVSEYVYEYMKVLLEEIDKGKINSRIIKNKFEEVYWKCPDLIYHILINIRIIYDKNEKEIKEFYEKKCGGESQKNKSLKKEKEAVYSKYNELVKSDERRILDSFVSGVNEIKDYDEKNVNQFYIKLVGKSKEELEENEYKEVIENIQKLYENLVEYSKFLEYRFISNEVLSIKKRIEADNIRQEEQNNASKDKKTKKTKAKQLSKYDEALENVKNKTKEIYKLNNTISDNNTAKTGVFKKKTEKIGEKEKKIAEVERDKRILELKDLYNTLDNAKFEKFIENNLDETSSIYDTLRIATYYYTFLAKTLIKNNSEILPKEITESIKNIKTFVEEYSFSVINNIKMDEKKDISVIIKDKFLLTGFQLTKDDINENTLEDMTRQLNILLISDSIDKSIINTKDISFYIKAKSIVNK